MTGLGSARSPLPSGSEKIDAQAGGKLNPDFSVYNRPPAPEKNVRSASNKASRDDMLIITKILVDSLYIHFWQPLGNLGPEQVV
jgi:hypothetical protein